jgi:hypothetical protein
LTTGGVEGELVVLLATLCTAAGAIPPFSPYLPAFLFFLLPTTFPSPSRASCPPIHYCIGWADIDKAARPSRMIG